MAAPSALSKLLATLKPVLSGPSFVFTTFGPNQPIPPSLPVQMMFREAEGTTLVTTRAAADIENIHYHGVNRLITLNMDPPSDDLIFHIAFLLKKLEDSNIDVSHVSGCSHDYLFVQLGSEEATLKCLEEVVREAQEDVKGE
ncbi:hypothetical protein E8E13_002195 [Curvularia kusanoi]|uniref:DUF2241 domain-containing protein n=1 Tax=Curvularia kusanoi TaxID=90978 RepID=A0A9P4W9X4_CURKU|nr:hypothetical protein E8E13_002195 [Curvularia kusanoi]